MICKNLQARKLARGAVRGARHLQTHELRAGPKHRSTYPNDTGTAHVVAATARAMLVLCGPTDPRRVKPLGAGVATMQADLPCINCYRKHCVHHACMRALTPGHVAARVLALAGLPAR